ncbi:pyridoxamine 5'-phosphate oxidase-domain-containing protein [Coprinopsis sp. MPI-PUGE-AT-0042]|nr:pyridoxamine 5'-phosphate oxidase-domain-containing protein [Coprinopsis sp. MPI-PUGE-AT-0042]
MISLLYTPIVLLGALLVVNGAETVYDAARIARTLVDNSKLSIASMATNFPEDDSQLPNYPFSMQEYYASCHQNGSLTLLFLPISRHSRNVLHNVKHAASLSVTSESPRASKPRVSLLGEISIFTNTSSVPKEIQQCYVQRHPDSKWWLPDDDDAAHISYWARFDPRAVYFVGGFGGLHYIGYIPLELYQEARLLKEVNPYQEQMISPREQ